MNMKYEITVLQTGDHYWCSEEENLLLAMAKIGKRGIPVGCASGGCGVCKVRIVKGQVAVLAPVSREHVSVSEEQQGITLACRVAPRSSVELEVVGRLVKPFGLGGSKKTLGT